MNCTNFSPKAKHESEEGNSFGPKVIPPKQKKLENSMQT